MEFKKVTKEQLTQLVAVIQNIWPEVYIPIIGQEQVDYMLATYQSAATIEQEIVNGAQYYLLVVNNEIVGYTAYEEQGEKIYLSKVYVSSRYRGQGLMRSIMQWYDELRQNKPLYLNVNQNNQLAINVYEHFGFVRQGERYEPIGNGFIMNDFIYEKL